jgi:hypothetical protein
LNKPINSHETLSLVSKSEEGDGGEYICWAENRAGKTETNFTLRVGYFSGSGIELLLPPWNKTAQDHN